MKRHHIHIVIPGLTPPSVNHYVKHARDGSHYKTPESKAFHDAAVMFARMADTNQGPLQVCEFYEVMIVVYFAKGQSGDIDNKSKVPLDALVSAGVIQTDSAIVDLKLCKRRDRENPRTEIWVRAAIPVDTPMWYE